MKIAILGIRGIPACYGGFETFAEELSARLALKGHEVTVFGRTHVIDYALPTYKGVNIILLPAPKHKYLETPIHTLHSLLRLVFLTPRAERPDVILVCNAANSPFVWLARLAGIPVAVNLDGIERKRAKWNRVGKLWYLVGEICSVLFASEMVADAEVIRRYYLENYRRDAVVIRYGTAGFRVGSDGASQDDLPGELPDKVLAQKLKGEFGSFPNAEIFPALGISPGSYLLYVSRLEPENNAHIVIQAYRLLKQSGCSLPLVIVGDAPYAKDYIKRLHELAVPGVVFAGYRFGAAYSDLQGGAYCYIQATEVGGTHPALVEAMGFANCVVANRTPENEEVLGDSGLFYRKNDPEDLALVLARVLAEPRLVKDMRYSAFQRAKQQFCWDIISNEYETLFQRMRRTVFRKGSKFSERQELREL